MLSLELLVFDLNSLMSSLESNDFAHMSHVKPNLFTNSSLPTLPLDLPDEEVYL